MNLYVYSPSLKCNVADLDQLGPFRADWG